MIQLTPQQQQFVEAQVASGLFREPTEVVDVAFDLLQERQREYEQLQSAISQVERGEVEPLEIEEIERRGREKKAQS